jgi:hypothetical protein
MQKRDGEPVPFAASASASPSVSFRPRPSAPPPSGGPYFGCTNDHSCWTSSDGLKLSADTYTTSFHTGQPQKVTVSLENTTDRPITVFGPRDCLLAVGAIPASNGPSAGGQASWTCVGSSQPQAQPEPQSGPSAGAPVTIAPHDKIAGDANVTLEHRGDWGIVGRCMCSDRTGEPKPTVTPGVSPTPKPVVGISVPGSATPPPPPPSASSAPPPMTTPPIRVTAA